MSGDNDDKMTTNAQFVPSYDLNLVVESVVDCEGEHGNKYYRVMVISDKQLPLNAIYPNVVITANDYILHDIEVRVLVDELEMGYRYNLLVKRVAQVRKDFNASPPNVKDKPDEPSTEDEPSIKVIMPSSDPTEATRYVILRLSDAKLLARSLIAGSNVFPGECIPVVNRLLDETGADMNDIVKQLKYMPTCHACDVEGQQHSCVSIIVKKIGRRLKRLVDRANMNGKR